MIPVIEAMLHNREVGSKLPSFENGYPLAYVKNNHTLVCHSCASECPEEITDVGINYESEGLSCNTCNEVIECAYPQELSDDVLRLMAER